MPPRQSATNKEWATTMSTTPTPTDQAEPISGRWRLDPTRSSVEFHVRHFYGLITVKGHFDRFDGTLDLDGKPAVELTIDADSLETKNRQRDKHRRSADFFGVEEHPQVRFVSDTVTLAGEKLTVHGQLQQAAPASRSSSTRRYAGSTVNSTLKP
jgi:polyisoprenoid-binding protein YceI